jgi:hypothetical protein
MIKDFKKLKEQLIELSEVINSFKSEQVQLKLVELIFGSTEAPASETVPEVSEMPIVRRGRKPKQTVYVQQPSNIRRTRSKDRPGPSLILKRLVDEGYFDERRTIGDVVAYCYDTLKFQYKSTDLSGTLARFVKEETLKREKNAKTNQFEYFK